MTLKKLSALAFVIIGVVKDKSRFETAALAAPVVETEDRGGLQKWFPLHMSIKKGVNICWIILGFADGSNKPRQGTQVHLILEGVCHYRECSDSVFCPMHANVTRLWDAKLFEVMCLTVDVVTCEFLSNAEQREQSVGHSNTSYLLIDPDCIPWWVPNDGLQLFDRWKSIIVLSGLPASYFDRDDHATALPVPNFHISSQCCHGAGNVECASRAPSTNRACRKSITGGSIHKPCSNSIQWWWLR